MISINRQKEKEICFTHAMEYFSAANIKYEYMPQHVVWMKKGLGKKIVYCVQCDSIELKLRVRPANQWDCQLRDGNIWGLRMGRDLQDPEGQWTVVGTSGKYIDMCAYYFSTYLLVYYFAIKL